MPSNTVFQGDENQPARGCAVPRVQAGGLPRGREPVGEGRGRAPVVAWGAGDALGYRSPRAPSGQRHGAGQALTWGCAPVPHWPLWGASGHQVDQLEKAGQQPEREPPP